MWPVLRPRTGRCLIDQRRIWHCKREEGPEGSLNAEAGQPRVDGRAGELVLVLYAELLSEGESCDPARDGSGW